MKLTFVGADHQVTGSCHYLQACGRNILVDCGMQQGINPYECCDIPVEEAKLDYVFLTPSFVCKRLPWQDFYNRSLSRPVFHYAA